MLVSQSRRLLFPQDWNLSSDFAFKLVASITYVPLLSCSHAFVQKDLPGRTCDNQSCSLPLVKKMASINCKLENEAKYAMGIIS